MILGEQVPGQEKEVAEMKEIGLKENALKGLAEVLTEWIAQARDLREGTTEVNT